MDELAEIMEPRRVQQPQAREVAGHSQLLRRRGEQQEIGRFPAEGFDHRVVTADRVRRPAEMMGLVDDDHIPAGIKRLLEPLFIPGEETPAREDELVVEERIGLRVGRLDRGAAFLVEDVEPEIEPPQQLHEPLVHQRIRHEDQHTLGAAREDQPMEDEAGFDRFAQAHFIRQQHAWQKPPGHFRRDVELVRDQVDAPADEPAHGRLPATMLLLQRGQPQVEEFGRIELPREQAFLGFVEADGVAQIRFAQLPSGAAVVEETGEFRDGLDGERIARVVTDRVTDAEAHAAKRGIVRRIFARLAARGKSHGDRAAGQPEHGAQAELGLAVADPTLAGMEVVFHRSGD